MKMIRSEIAAWERAGHPREMRRKVEMRQVAESSQRLVHFKKKLL